MNKLHLNARCGVSLLAACWIAGCATSAHAPGPARADDALAASNPGCVAHTGSRVPDPRGCVSGRSYSQSDIAGTGQTTAAGALGLLDPALTVHR